MALLQHRATAESVEPSWAPDDWPDRFFRPWTSVFRGEKWIRVDEFAEDGTLVLRADLPGVDPDEDIEISLSGRLLTIEAVRREEEKTEKRHYVCSELRYGSFSRTITVPEGTRETDISARYRDGVLEVRVPYPEAKPTIKVPVVKEEPHSRSAS